jgi:2'-5' RNA ligase
MPRLFTGLEIPHDIRMSLSLLRAPMAGAKWIEPEDMHITLRFAGDIDARTADELADLLAAVRARAFPVTIRGVGSFGGREPRVLWAGVEAGPQLDQLYRAHERAARGAGLEPAEHDFRPHVTLARLRRAKPREVARFLGENGALATEPFTVERFVLWSARPGSGGGPYAVEAAFPLGGGGERSLAVP